MAILPEDAQKLSPLVHGDGCVAPRTMLANSSWGIANEPRTERGDRDRVEPWRLARNLHYHHRHPTLLLPMNALVEMFIKAAAEEMLARFWKGWNPIRVSVINAAMKVTEDHHDSSMDQGEHRGSHRLGGNA